MAFLVLKLDAWNINKILMLSFNLCRISNIPQPSSTFIISVLLSAVQHLFSDKPCIVLHSIYIYTEQSSAKNSGRTPSKTSCPLYTASPPWCPALQIPAASDTPNSNLFPQLNSTTVRSKFDFDPSFLYHNRKHISRQKTARRWGLPHPLQGRFFNV